MSHAVADCVAISQDLTATVRALLSEADDAASAQRNLAIVASVHRGLNHLLERVIAAPDRVAAASCAAAAVRLLSALREEQSDILNAFLAEELDCPVCGGSGGGWGVHACTTCKGSGRNPTRRDRDPW